MCTACCWEPDVAHAAGRLLAMSGPRAPYDGRLGVIAEGALADLLVIDAEPEVGLDWLDSPAESLAMIMKGGRIHKDALLEILPKCTG